MSGSARRPASTVTCDLISAWMSSFTSQTVTFQPATTKPSLSQNAMNSSDSGSPR